jgi:hypothetical protein
MTQGFKRWLGQKPSSADYLGKPSIAHAIELYAMAYTRDERENPTRWLLRASERAFRGDYLGKPLPGLPSSSFMNIHSCQARCKSEKADIGAIVSVGFWPTCFNCLRSTTPTVRRSRRFVRTSYQDFCWWP